MLAFTLAPSIFWNQPHNGKAYDVGVAIDLFTKSPTAPLRTGLL